MMFRVRLNRLGILYSFRKRFLASVTQIVRLLSLDFAQTVIIAALIAFTDCLCTMEEWLSNYFIRISLNGWIFLFVIVVILLLAMITVTFQRLRQQLQI